MSFTKLYPYIHEYIHEKRRVDAQSTCTCVKMGKAEANHIRTDIYTIAMYVCMYVHRYNSMATRAQDAKVRKLNIYEMYHLTVLHTGNACKKRDEGNRVVYGVSRAPQSSRVSVRRHKA